MSAGTSFVLLCLHIFLVYLSVYFCIVTGTHACSLLGDSRTWTTPETYKVQLHQNARLLNRAQTLRSYARLELHVIHSVLWLGERCVRVRVVRVRVRVRV